MRKAGVLALIGALTLSACGGGSGGPPGPSPSPTPDVSCPTSGSLPASVASSVAPQSEVRLAPAGAHASREVPGQLAVTYDASLTQRGIDRVAAQFGAARITDTSYERLGVRTRVLYVDPANAENAARALQGVPGVRTVGRVSYRSRMSITANDPYYAGFLGAPAPYYETTSIPGQWDMHVINLDGAWSQFSSAPIVAAPIAIVDTGVDVTHPELITPSGVPAPKIERAQCYVTYPSSSSQTTGPYVTDTDGHGTDVAGISDGDTNNNFGFAGVAFDAPMLAYRIFPNTPSGGCETSTSAQCDASSADEASAINDAVAHGAKVINLSLGAAPPCSSSDPEYVAVENAIASGVVVVAAAGNGNGTPSLGQPALDCPAADPGVIAVGGTSINDSNPASPYEYVASYSNYLTNSGVASGGAYLVAPGGDPGSNSDADNLHWIEHIYSSTAVQPGACGPDYANESGNCRIFIAGTSQATPHVAGVVSLMLAKKPTLTPAQIATGLCASADNIGDAKEGCGRVNAAAAVTWAATH